MKKFSEFIVEKELEKVIYVNGEIWVTYGQGSGQTALRPDLKKFMSDDNSDKEHFDSLAGKILEVSKSMKPIKKGGNSKMFEMPEYPSARYGKYDIWGGDIKPIKKLYFVITEEKNIIINFFENKNEAVNWVKTSN